MHYLELKKNNKSSYGKNGKRSVSYDINLMEQLQRYKFLVITNLTHFFMYLFIYFMSLHVSSVTALIIRRSNCINTSSGMISLCK